MSHSLLYSVDDDDPFSSSYSNSTPLPPDQATEGRGPRLSSGNYNRYSGDWSSARGSVSSKRDTLPPTRTGILRPEDTIKVDPFKLVKPDTVNPLSAHAKETISVMEKQKEAQKERKRSIFEEESTGADWESNLSSWKDRRKSNYQPKAIDLNACDDDDELGKSARKSKTFKELMEDRGKRSNGSIYTYDSDENVSRKTDSTTGLTSYQSKIEGTSNHHPESLAQGTTVDSYSASRPTGKTSASTSLRYLNDETRQEKPEYSASKYLNSYTTADTTELPSKKTTDEGNTFELKTAVDSDRMSWRSSTQATKESPETKATSTYGVPTREITEVKTRSTYGVPTREITETRIASTYGVPTMETTETKTMSTYGVPTRAITETKIESTYGVPMSETTETRTRSTYGVPTRETTETRTRSTYGVPTREITETKIGSTPTKETTETRTRSTYGGPTRETTETRTRSTYGVPNKETTETKTTSTYGVTMRDKPQRSVQQRPSSYVYSPPTKSETTRQISAKPASTRQESLVGRTTDRQPSNTTTSSFYSSMSSSYVPGALTKDRKAMSNWELNYGQSEKSDRPPELRSYQKPTTDGGSKFKQTLSLFQSKEAEVSQSPALKAPLMPQRFITKSFESKISKPTQDAVKTTRTGYASPEVSRPGLTDRWKSQTELGQSDRTRREASRDTSRSLYPTQSSALRVSDGKGQSVLDRDWTSKDRRSKTELNKSEIIPDVSSTSSSSKYSTPTNYEEKEKLSTTSKLNADQLDGGRKQVNNDIDEKDVSIYSWRDGREERGDGISSELKPDKHKDESLERNIYIRKYNSSNSSRNSGTPASDCDSDSATSGKLEKAARPKTSSYEASKTDVKPTTYEQVPNTREDKRLGDWRSNPEKDSSSVKVSLPSSKMEDSKFLYAYKYSTPNSEESLVEESHLTNQIKTDANLGDKRYDGVSEKTESNFKILGSDPIRFEVRLPSVTKSSEEVRSSRIQETGEEKNSVPYQSSYKAPERILSTTDSFQKPVYQPSTSISDIFRKRSAVVRGKGTPTELEPPEMGITKTVEVTTRVTDPVEGTRKLPVRSTGEKGSSQGQESPSDYKKAWNEGNRSDVEKKSTKDDDAGERYNVNLKEPSGRTVTDKVEEISRVSREPYRPGDLGKRNIGFQRDYTAETVHGKGYGGTVESRADEPKEPVKKQEQSPSFEFNFTISELEKPPIGKEEKRNIRAGNVDEDKVNSNLTDIGKSFRNFEESLVVEKKSPNYKVKEPVKPDLFQPPSRGEQEKQDNTGGGSSWDSSSGKKSNDDIQVEKVEKVDLLLDFDPFEPTVSQTSKPSAPGSFHFDLDQSLTLNFVDPAKNTDQTEHGGKLDGPPKTETLFMDLLVEIPSQENKSASSKLGKDSSKTDLHLNGSSLLDGRSEPEVPSRNQQTRTNHSGVNLLDDWSFMEPEKFPGEPKMDVNSNIPAKQETHGKDDTDYGSSFKSNKKEESQPKVSPKSPLEQDQTVDSGGVKGKSGLDEEVAESSGSTIPGSSLKKKQPPEPPKTKPKPTKVADEISPMDDDTWNGIPATERLDVSAFRDRCRLSKAGSLAARRRPKSAIILTQETDDIDGYSQNSDDKLQQKDETVPRVEMRTKDAKAADVAATQLLSRPKSSTATTRPMSYMGELSSSLQKKFKDNAQLEIEIDPKSTKLTKTSAMKEQELVTEKLHDLNRPGATKVKDYDDDDDEDAPPPPLPDVPPPPLNWNSFPGSNPPGSNGSLTFVPSSNPPEMLIDFTISDNQPPPPAASSRNFMDWSTDDHDSEFSLA